MGAAGGAAAERENHLQGQTAPRSADPTYARQAFEDLVAYLAGEPPSPALALALGLTPIPPEITLQTLARFTGRDPSVFLRSAAAAELPPDLPAWLARYR